MGKYYLGSQSGMQVNFSVADATGVVNDLNLSGLYLSLSGKAADSDLLDGNDSTYYRNAANLTGAVTLSSGVFNYLNVTGTLDADSFVRNVNAKTGHYTLTTSDDNIVFNSATPYTATLIPASSNVGRQFVITNKGTAQITVDATYNGQIDGANASYLEQYKTLVLISDGTTWN